MYYCIMLKEYSWIADFRITLLIKNIFGHLHGYWNQTNVG